VRGESVGNLHRGDGISEATLRRLSNYYRILEDMLAEGIRTASSSDLAARYGTTSAQVRKDLSNFGSFGHRGMGYDVEGLRGKVAEILGIDAEWDLVLVGAGNLGHALFHYAEFQKQGFRIRAVFDSDPDLAGEEWDGVPVRPLEELDAVVREMGARMGIIAVPAASGQEVAERLLAAGVEGILNFSPVKLTVPENAYIRNVNLSIAMESLSYSLSKHSKLKPF
jgi:redox-sensing transcriptional repressor